MLLFAAIMSFSTTPGTFKTEQLRFKTVRDAYAQKQQTVDAALKAKGLERANLELFLRAFKQEEKLQVWARSRTAKGQWKLVKSYDFCMLSGDLGPKRRQGDGQVPEGFYYIDRYNPASSYLLSLGLNYPNAADRKRGEAGNLGGDIFIHGSCVSVGCIPITDPLVQELYILALEAHDQGQQHIPVHVFPFNFANKPESSWPNNSKHTAFWKNLRQGFEHFERNKRLPTVSVNAQGNYQFGS